MPSVIHDQNIDSISDSIVHISDDEIKEGLIEILKSRKNQHQEDLEKLNSALNQKDYADLIEIWNKLDSDAGLDSASTFTDLIAGKIAGFGREQLLEMLNFSKISYGNVDQKLEKGKYKTKRQFEKEGYQIIKFYDNELIEDKYCLDTDYKLEQHDVGYALIGSNSYNRDAGYVFIKDKEVTIAYHGTRDLNDVKEDLRASLAKLSFLPEDHRVHSGFYSLFKRSWPSVHKILKGHANDKGLKIEDLKINVTGHSMGGALASIAALCLNKTEGAEDVHVATFGSPRVFYNGVAEVYNECLGNKTVRVACQSDPVPCLPHGNAGMHYKHVGKPLKLETGKALEYLEPHYHKIDTYYNLIQEVEQENFKSDNNSSKYRHVAYIFGLFYHALLSLVDVDDEEFFKKVEEENKDIKLSEIPIERAPNVEEKLKKGEEEVAKLTNDKTQLEKRLNSIQQSLTERTKELKRKEIQLEENKRGLDDANQKVLQLQEKLKYIEAQLEQEREGANEKLIQEQQKTNQLNDQVDKLTEELKGTRDHFVGRKAELDEQTRKATKLNSTIKELKATNAELEIKNSNLTNQLEKLAATNAKLEKNVGNLNNQFVEEKKALEDLRVQSEQNKNELKKAKTELEKKVEFTRKELEDAQAQLKESERGLDAAKKNILQLEKDLKQAQQNLVAKTKEFENAVNKLQKGLDEKTSEAAQLREVKVQFVESKQKLAEETNKVTQLSKESNKTQAQLEEKKKEIGELKDQVTQLTAQNTQLEKWLNSTKQGLTDEITQLENENNNLKTKLHKSENKSKELERNLQKQSESKNEELNEKFLKARIYSEEQGNYASVSFVLSGAFAVGASLTMLHLAICISLAVAALTFLAVGCYCSYNANTALNNVEVGQIGNDASHSVV